MVTPSCAVPTIVIILVPVFKLMLPDAVPDATGAPFTVTVAVGSIVVGVTVIDAVELLTVPV